MTEVRNFALEATKRYLQSIVFVDDKIYYEIPVTSTVVNTETMKVMTVFKPIAAPAEETGASAAVAAGDLEYVAEESGVPFHPKHLVESFAKQRMVCALYEPAEGFASDGESDIFRLCERADAVILDWEFYKEPGTRILPLIAGLVSKSQTTVPHHVRLCAIYTTTPDLKRVAQQIFDYLRKETLPVEPEGDLNLVAGSTKIVVLGKPSTGRPREQMEKAEVTEKELADRIISEFAAMHEGILPSMALDGLAAVRTSSKRILDKFRSDMDGAFLVHRGLIYPGDDAFEQIPELLAEEALAVMSDTLLESGRAKRLAAETVDSFKITLDWKAKGGRPTAVAGALATKLLKEGRGGIAKDFELDKPAIEALHRHVDTKGVDAEKRLAALYNTRTQYVSRRDLCFGTIVRRLKDGSPEYLLCLMPLCDSVRLSTAEGKVYQFPFWRLRTDNNGAPSKGMVVELPSAAGFIQLFSMGKPREQMWMTGFKASASKTVAATEEGGKFIYRGVEPDVTVEWIAQLKPSHALRIAHDIGSSFSRVGVLEAEWLRLWAERQ